MKKILFKYWPLLVLIILGLYLRTHHLSAFTTFEWDQARDVDAMTEILRGKMTLIGPVVRGEGSFFLGPLYYYIGAFLLMLSSGNPLILSVFSVVLDVVVGAMLYQLLIKKSVWQATAATAIWMCSVYLIKLAHIPWNVSLMQLWIIGMIYLWRNYEQNHQSKYFFYLLAGFSTHIHLSLVGVSFVFILTKLKNLKNIQFSQILTFIGLYILPILPLILFDVRHDFLETKLFMSFLTHGTSRANLNEFVPLLLTKLDYTLSELVAGSRIMYLGLIVSTVAILSSLAKDKTGLNRLMFYVFLTIPLMLLFYRDLGFAEYYLAPTFIPLIYLLVANLDWARFYGKFLLTICLVVMPIYSLRHLDFAPPAFSLSVKEEIAQFVKGYGNTVELRLYAPPGRKDGIKYLLKQKGVRIKEKADLVVIIDESDKIATLLDRTSKIGEQVFGGLRVTIFGVQ